MVREFELGDICSISRGVVMSKDFIRDNKGEYPVYSSQTENNGELGKISTYNFDGEYLTWTTDGANAGRVFYRNGKFSVTNVCGLLDIKNKDIVLPKYLYYALSIETDKYVNKGMGNAKLMSNVMSKIPIYIPFLERQKEIVDILDRFSLLAESMEVGIPAEIKANRQRYEYYRDEIFESLKECA